MGLVGRENKMEEKSREESEEREKTEEDTRDQPPSDIASHRIRRRERYID